MVNQYFRPQVKKPILQSADYSGNVLEKIQTRLPLFAPSCSPATEKVHFKAGNTITFIENITLDNCLSKKILSMRQRHCSDERVT